MEKIRKEITTVKIRRDWVGGREEGPSILHCVGKKPGNKFDSKEVDEMKT